MGCGDTPRASSVTGSFQSLFVTMGVSSDLTTAAVDLEESLRAKGEEDERRAVTGAEDEQPVVTGAVAEVALARRPDAVAVVVMSLCRSN